MNRVGMPAFFVLGVIAVAELICALGWISPLLLAPPHKALAWIVMHAADPQLYHDIGITLRRVGIAFGLSAVIGIPIGALMGYFRFVERVLTFPVDFSRSIPATALFPLFLIFLGPVKGRALPPPFTDQPDHHDEYNERHQTGQRDPPEISPAVRCEARKYMPSLALQVQSDTQ